MNNFFERQDTARRKTGLLVSLFFAAVVLIIVSIYVVVTVIFFMNKTGPLELWAPGRFVSVFILTLLVVVGGTIYRIAQLRDGGYKVAQMLGGRLVPRNSADLAEKRLLNVVEEMAIASGVPVPDVYVMDEETGINAFAAGHGIDDAIICVTKGALDLLTRDELQGVVAHEFSHILNSDVAINIRLMGWLYGILMISLVGQFILRGTGRRRSYSSRSRGKGGGGIIVLGLALYILGSIGVFFGNLIKSAVSRQREYLADASAVQFTRNPGGLAGALKKIGGLAYGSILAHPRAGEASHMFISPGLQKGLLDMLATHPPLEARIKQLDPYFNGVYPKTIEHPVVKPYLAKPLPTQAQREAQAARVLSGAAVLAILDSAGEPMQAHHEQAQRMMMEVPGPVMEATREPYGACALIYLLLLGPDEQYRTRRLDMLRKYVSFETYEETFRLVEYLPALNPRARLPLIDLAMPSLRQLSEEQYRTFKENVTQLIIADEKMSLFEYVLRYVVIRRLDAHFGKTKTRIAQIYSVRGVEHECSVVLSVFAHVGQRTMEEAAKAFERGRQVLDAPQVNLEFLETRDCTLKDLDRALDRMAVTGPKVKQRLLAACLQSMVYDQRITIGEVELFRAVTEALGVPVPPWLNGLGDEDTPAA